MTTTLSAGHVVLIVVCRWGSACRRAGCSLWRSLPQVFLLKHSDHSNRLPGADLAGVLAVRCCARHSSCRLHSTSSMALMPAVQRRWAVGQVRMCPAAYSMRPAQLARLSKTTLHLSCGSAAPVDFHVPRCRSLRPRSCAMWAVLPSMRFSSSAVHITLFRSCCHIGGSSVINRRLPHLDETPFACVDFFARHRLRHCWTAYGPQSSRRPESRQLNQIPTSSTTPRTISPPKLSTIRRSASFSSPATMRKVCS